MPRLCRECEEPIPEARLKALPKTLICVDCQTILEREGHFARHKITVVASGDIDKGVEVEQKIVRG